MRSAIPSDDVYVADIGCRHGHQPSESSAQQLPVLGVGGTPLWPLRAASHGQRRFSLWSCRLPT